VVVVVVAIVVVVVVVGIVVVTVPSSVLPHRVRSRWVIEGRKPMATRELSVSLIQQLLAIKVQQMCKLNRLWRRSYRERSREGMMYMARATLLLLLLLLLLLRLRLLLHTSSPEK